MPSPVICLADGFPSAFMRRPQSTRPASSVRRRVMGAWALTAAPRLSVALPPDNKCQGCGAILAATDRRY